MTTAPALAEKRTYRKAIRWGKGRLSRFGLAAFAVGGLAYSAYFFFFGYFHVYPVIAARSYEYGFKELADFQVSRENQPILVIWDGYYPNLYFRFWQRTPPREYLAFRSQDIRRGETVFYQRFPNLYFAYPKSPVDIDMFLAGYPVDYLVFPADFLSKNPAFILPARDEVRIIKYPDRTDDFVIYRLSGKTPYRPGGDTNLR